MKTCKECRFCHIEEVHTGIAGGGMREEFQCRRHAPQIIHGSGTGWSDRLFPEVQHDTWCGEYEEESKR